jgi:hypothetical protein
MGCCEGKQAVKPAPTSIVPPGGAAFGASNKIAAVRQADPVNAAQLSMGVKQPSAVAPQLPGIDNEDDWETHYTADATAVAYAKQKGRPVVMKDGTEQIAYYHNKLTGESKWDSPGISRGVHAVDAAMALQTGPRTESNPESNPESKPESTSPAKGEAGVITSNQLEDKLSSSKDSGALQVEQAADQSLEESVVVPNKVAAESALVNQPEAALEPTMYEKAHPGSKDDPYVQNEMEKAKNKELEDSRDPKKFAVRVQFAGKVKDGALVKHKDELGFRFYVPKPAGNGEGKLVGGTKMDELVEEIAEAFGYSPEQLRLFYDGKLCSKSATVFDTVGLSYLDPVESTSLAIPIFVLYTNGDAEQNPEHIFKPVDRSVHPRRSIFEASSMNWMGQYITLQNQLSISNAPKIKAANVHTGDNTFEGLMPQLVVEKQMYDLHTRFFQAAKQEAETLVAQCHQQLQDAGVPGAWWRYPNSMRKQVKNNIEMQEIRDWFVLHNKWERKGDKGKDAAMLDAAGKMANHELRGLQIARDAVDGLYTPLCAIIDVAGVQFLATAVFSGGPKDECSIVYGSDEFGLHIKDGEDDANCLEIVNSLSNKLNLRAHKVVSPIDSTMSTLLVLPIGSRIYRLGASTGQPIYFLQGGMHLCPRAVNADGRSYNPWQRVRGEYATNFGLSQDLAEGWEYHTSLEPVMCSESNVVITDYQYYTYVSSGTKRKEYNCSLAEYKERVRTNNFNGVSRKDLKIVTVPVRLREEYWKNLNTGSTVTTKPINRTPLNPDWAEHNDPKAKAEMATLARLLEAEAPDPEHDDDPDASKELSVLDHLVEDLKEIFEEDNYFTEDGRELPVEDVFEEEFTPNTGEELVKEMHKRGLSMYLLGAVLSRLSKGEKYNHLRQMCTKEIIARSVKALIRAEIRSGSPRTRKGQQSVADDDEGSYGGDKYTSQVYLRQVMRYHLNLVFQPTDARTEASQVLWRKLKSYSNRQFGFEVTHANLEGKGHISKETVLHACCKQLRIKLRGIPALDQDGLVVRAKGKLDFTLPEPIHLDDIAEVLPSSRCVLYEGATVTALLQRGQIVDAKGTRSKWPQIGGPERAEATEILRHAVQAASMVYGGESKQAIEARRMLSEQLKSRHSEKGRPELSRWNRCGQVTEDDLSIEARGYLEFNKQLLLRDGMSMDLAQCCLGLAQLSKDPLNHSDNSNHIAAPDRLKNGPPQCECARSLNEASVVTEALLGTHHPASARLYMNWAGTYQDLASFDDASTWLRHAFLVHEGMYGLNHPATLECWRRLKTVEVKVHGGLQDVPMENLKEEIEKDREMQESDSEYEGYSDDEGDEETDDEGGAYHS